MKGVTKFTSNSSDTSKMMFTFGTEQLPTALDSFATDTLKERGSASTSGTTTLDLTAPEKFLVNYAVKHKDEGEHFGVVVNQDDDKIVYVKGCENLRKAAEEFGLNFEYKNLRPFMKQPIAIL